MTPRPRILVAMLAVSSACATSHKAPEPFNLEWRGAGSPPLPSALMAQVVSQHTFALQPCVDARSVPASVGVIEETQVDLKVRNNVGEFCSQRLALPLTQAGFQLASTADAISLTPELVAFSVIEGSVYRGDVRIRLTATPPGKPAFSTLYAGSSKRWGKSESIENYNETLSNAFSSAVTKLVTDDEGLGQAIGAP